MLSFWWLQPQFAPLMDLVYFDLFFFLPSFPSDTERHLAKNKINAICSDWLINHGTLGVQVCVRAIVKTIPFIIYSKKLKNKK